MEERYITQMTSGFLDELAAIEKQAGVVGFLGSGLKRLATGAATAVKPGGGMTMALGGRGAVRAGGLGSHMKQLWQAGAKKAQAAGNSGFMGGLGTLARSRYGQMAAATAVPLAAGYGVSKMM